MAVSRLLLLSIIGLWIFQTVATAAGIQDWSGLSVAAAALIAMPAAAVPVFGTILAVLGALYAWNWAVRVAVLAFVGPLIVIVAMIVLAAFSAWDALDGLRSFWPRRP